jgi:hypothetical protein
MVPPPALPEPPLPLDPLPASSPSSLLSARRDLSRSKARELGCWISKLFSPVHVCLVNKASVWTAVKSVSVCL